MRHGGRDAKKALTNTTALIAATLAAERALAVDVEWELGGFIVAGVGAGEHTASDLGGQGPNQDAVPVDQAFHVIRDGEIHFNASGALDNGIRIEARVEIEVYGDKGDDDVVDENWVRVISSFGTIMIGGNDDALNNIGDAGVARLGNRISLFNTNFNFTPGSNLDQVFGSDSLGVHYYSPNLFGLTLGVSLQPDISSDGDNDDISTGSDNDDNRVVLAARYEGEYESVTFEIGGGFGFENQTSGATRAWGVGAELGFHGWRFAVRYEAERAADDECDGLAIPDECKRSLFNVFNVGVRYETGDWTFALMYGFEEQDAGEIDNGNFDNGGDTTRILAGAAYAIGDGVLLTGEVNYGEIDNITDPAASGGPRANDSAFGGTLLNGVQF